MGRRGCHPRMSYCEAGRISCTTSRASSGPRRPLRLVCFQFWRSVALVPLVVQATSRTPSERPPRPVYEQKPAWRLWKIEQCTWRGAGRNGMLAQPDRPIRLLQSEQMVYRAIRLHDRALDLRQRWAYMGRLSESPCPRLYLADVYFACQRVLEGAKADFCRCCPAYSASVIPAQLSMCKLTMAH